MNILLLNTSFPPMARSAAHLFYELGCYLLDKGHRVSVVTEIPWRRLGSENIAFQHQAVCFHFHEVMDGMHVVRIKGFPFREGSTLGRGINATLVPLTFFFGARYVPSPDIILVYSPPLTLGFTAYLFKRFHNVPFVFNAQDIYPQTPIELGLMKNPLLINFSEWIEQFIYKEASRIVVHSQGNHHYLVSRKSVPSGKVTVIHNWVDTEVLRPSERLNGFRHQHQLENRFVVCYAGTMGYAQDLLPIIEAAQILEEVEDILFLLIGEGIQEAKWKRKVGALGLKNVRFLPLQAKSIYPSIIAASDIGIVPLTKNLHTPVVPGKLLDFMAGSRPIIATANLNGDTAKIIREAGCGYVLPPQDGRQVAEAILELYRDPSAASRMGTNGRAYTKSRFSLKICGAQYEELFRQLLSGI
jgi:glycosyltransferase involved in cell wall biosynthesis